MLSDVCLECGGEIPGLSHAGRKFCSDRCRYRHRDRERYAADPEREREKSRAWYARNREKKLAYMRERNRKGS